MYLRNFLGWDGVKLAQAKVTSQPSPPQSSPVQVGPRRSVAHPRRCNPRTLRSLTGKVPRQLLVASVSGSPVEMARTGLKRAKRLGIHIHQEKTSTRPRERKKQATIGGIELHVHRTTRYPHPEIRSNCAQTK
ncbi:uncharacterized protein BKA55DRAFT_120758 [Fusarium redolens]|uniref:Uncharacterized protein n=1 Tax=Fusarium redolens TaxID=48865 RepID=A0A9P9GGE2_FUSRE|nr:uncharacterized protein BKA55DRAFT_120758 [Fusarium redolens]KAH7237472.1 hypothetical protein BKA55DRAFT_120758 [Fusarium redolens]